MQDVKAEMEGSDTYTKIFSEILNILLALPVGMAVKCSFSQKFNLETVANILF